MLNSWYNSEKFIVEKCSKVQLWTGNVLWVAWSLTWSVISGAHCLKEPKANLHDTIIVLVLYSGVWKWMATSHSLLICFLSVYSAFECIVFAYHACSLNFVRQKYFNKGTSCRFAYRPMLRLPPTLFSRCLGIECKRSTWACTKWFVDIFVVCCIILFNAK